MKNLLSSVVESLQANPDRRFIVVEQVRRVVAGLGLQDSIFQAAVLDTIAIVQAFFQMWWDEQSAQVQEVTCGLVASGQLEFINGGWAMHDETDNTYAEQIDQTTLGHRFILSQFNVTPRTTWQARLRIGGGCGVGLTSRPKPAGAASASAD